LDWSAGSLACGAPQGAKSFGDPDWSAGSLACGVNRTAGIPARFRVAATRLWFHLVPLSVGSAFGSTHG